MTITLVGVGMGAAATMTLEARRALAEADVVYGAERLLAALPDGVAARRVRLAIPERVAAAILAEPEDGRRICVALSGDVGFHSGARRLFELLAEREPKALCGVSTPQYFAARLGRPWQDFRLVSAHGVACDALAEALNHPAVFFLTGGDATVAGIARELCAAGLGDAGMTVGENLAALDERITALTAAEAAGREFSALSVALVENRRTFARPPGPAGIADAAFVRGPVPMTKREVRAVVLALLGPKPDAVLYDIGAGTGSVAVEMALQARRGRIHAVESDADALALIAANRERFGVYNLAPAPGTAPEALAPLPPPDAAFIGGSRGRMAPIVRAVLAKNPAARLVISAVTPETLADALTALAEAGVAEPEVVQVAATRYAIRGGRHMPEAQNPVFLLAGGGGDG